jgi:hypothetical protein
MFENVESKEQLAATAKKGIERLLRMISSFRREVGESCLLLCYYLASSGNFLPTFWDR